MMLFSGTLIVLGAVLDIVVNGYTGLHLLFLCCGLILVLLNVFAHKLPVAMVVGKNILSIVVLVLTSLFLFGFFSGNTLLSSDNAAAVIKKAEKINARNGAVEAVAYIEKASSTFEWNRDLALEAGKLNSLAGNSEKAKSKYNEILGKDAFDKDARYQLALELIKEKNHTKGIEQLMYIIKLDSGYADAHMSLGDCYWALGDNIHGIYYYKLAVELDTNSVEKRVKLAQAYAGMQSFDEADREFKTVLDMAKDFNEQMFVYNTYSAMKARIGKNTTAGSETK